MTRASGATADGSWPQRRVTLVVPFGPGASTYGLARSLARRLGQALGQTVTVESRPGRNGMFGTCSVGEAEPDGHTLLLAISGVYAIAAQLDPCPFPLLDRLSPIGVLATSQHVLCVPAASGFRTFADLVAAARHAPGAVRYLTPYAYYLPVLAIADALGLRLSPVAVASGSAGDALRSLARGEAEFTLVDVQAALPAVRSGMVRALAVAATHRVPMLPEVPTFGETGAPALLSANDFALFVPAGTPDVVLDRLSAVVREIMQAPDTLDVLMPLGIQPIAARREEFPLYFEAETRRWRRLIDVFGIPRP